MSSPDSRKPFSPSQPIHTWRRIYEGRLDALQGIFSGKLKMGRPSMAQIQRNPKANLTRWLMSLNRLIPIRIVAYHERLSGQGFACRLDRARLWDEALNETYARKFVARSGLPARYLYDLRTPTLTRSPPRIRILPDRPAGSAHP